MRHDGQREAFGRSRDRIAIAAFGETPSRRRQLKAVLACGEAENIERILADVAVGEKLRRLSDTGAQTAYRPLCGRRSHAAAVHHDQIFTPKIDLPFK